MRSDKRAAEVEPVERRVFRVAASKQRATVAGTGSIIGAAGRKATGSRVFNDDGRRDPNRIIDARYIPGGPCITALTTLLRVPREKGGALDQRHVVDRPRRSIRTIV